MGIPNYVNEWWIGCDPDPSNYDCNLAQSLTVADETNGWTQINTVIPEGMIATDLFN